jgi:hypothetical protein
MSNPTVTATISANDLASPKIRELMATLKQAEKILKEAFNGDIGGKYAAGLNNATAAAQKHLGVLQQVHSAHKAIAATVAGYAAFKLTHGAYDAIKEALPYLREDRAAQARTGYSDQDMQALRRQQADVATRYGARIEDTLKAQETFGRLQYNAATNVAMINPTVVGAKAMGVPPDQVAELIETLTSQTGMRFESPEDAAAKTKRLNDIAAAATKKSNMSFEDVLQFESFSAAAANSAGLTPEQNLAMGMALRRGGIVGSEAGVFSRQFAARVMAPTRKGRDALAQYGINIDDFATHGVISGEGLSDKLARDFGKGLSAASIARLNKDLEERGGEILGSRGAYGKAVLSAVEETEGGSLSATDRKHITSKANEYYDFSKSGFKGGALLEALLNSGNPMAMQALLGDKQGARANALLTEADKYYQAKKDLQGADGFSQHVADQMMQGLAAAADRLTASFDSLEKSLVQANEVWLTPMVDAATSVVTHFNNLSDTGKEVAGALAGITTTVVGGGLAYAFVRTVMNVNALAVSAGEASVALQALAARGALPGGSTSLPARAAPGVLVIAGAATSVIGGFITGAWGKYAQWQQIRGGDKPLTDATLGNWWNDPDMALVAAAANEQRRQGKIWDNIPVPTQGRFDRFQPTMLDAPTSRYLLAGATDGTGSKGWQDSIVLGSIRHSEGFGDPGKVSSQLEVQGTVTGEAELHVGIQGQLTPTPYFMAVIQRAEAVANMGINGRLGTSMQGPGDNSVKPLGGPLTGTQQ